MVQINTDTRKERQIRAPRKWKAPSKPLVPVPSEAAVTATGSPVKGDKKSSVASAACAGP